MEIMELQTLIAIIMMQMKEDTSLRSGTICVNRDRKITVYFMLIRICKVLRKSILDRIQVVLVVVWSVQRRETITHGGIQVHGMILLLLHQNNSIASRIKLHNHRM